MGSKKSWDLSSFFLFIYSHVNTLFGPLTLFLYEKLTWTFEHAFLSSGYWQLKS
jgi:hypothetical protein